MANKPLVIDVSPKSVPSSAEADRWSYLSNMSVFIRDILTPALHQKSDVGAIVSGIPTAFARVDLFKAALDRANSLNPEGGVANLNSYYSTLVSEWRGFIACLALDYPKISVKRVNLEYHDGLGISETANIYEPLGAFGNMLLERKPLWSEPSSAMNEKNVPFIDIVKYDGQVVGGTSPETFLFTSVGYNIDKPSGRPWINASTGKFIDPLGSDMTQDQTITLYAYVNHIIENMGLVENYFSTLPDNIRPNYNNLRNNLNEWEREIADYAKSRNYDLNAASIPPVDARFDPPYNMILNFKDELYGLEGVLYEQDTKDAIKFDPKRLLLSKDAEIARLHLGADISRDPSLLSRLPVYVLKASKVNAPDQYAYFALPLSALGLNVFGKNIGALVGLSEAGVSVRSTLTATYDPDKQENNLDVVLHLVMNTGKEKDMKETYTVRSEGINHRDILIWPNFISRQWDRYFLFSEMPHNVSTPNHPYRAMPFVGDDRDDFFRIMTDADQQPVYLAEDGEIISNDKGVKADLIITSDNRVADNNYKYEIYESNKPFKGVRLASATKKDGGYLIIHYSSDPNSGLPLNQISDSDRALKEVNLGVDFGSTNTSIAYFNPANMDDTRAHGFSIGNMRVSLLGNDAGRDDDIIRRENQLLFFQTGQIRSNAIKSMLTLHDPRRLGKGDNENSERDKFAKEVKGGFPCFANNLPIVEVTDSEIHLRFNGCGNITVVHNMKWSEQEMDKARKEAFLRSLLLQVYAQLFREGYVPTSLNWSYPSSMGKTLLDQYDLIWKTLDRVSPVRKLDGEHYQLDIAAARLNDLSDAVGQSDPVSDTWGLGGDSVADDMWGGMQTSASASSDSASGWGDDSGAGWGSPEPATSANSGWGVSSGSGWGNEEKKEDTRPDLRPDDPDRRITFNPTLMFDRESKTPKTEAASVANFMSSSGKGRLKEPGILTICFDIGGSTTDISAMINAAPNGIIMIKQNSIRFAAQRVATATRYARNFGNVLLKTCSKFGIKIQGLNIGGPSQFTPEKSPYYFEQIVDRLKVDELPEFYKLIIADCPELMSVNLYVTGLIMYYAGQLAAKLIDDIRHNTDLNIPPMAKPKVDILFAGKGSRLFEWFSTTSPQAAQQYYTELFVRGMGGKARAMQFISEPPKIGLSSSSSEDVKYEVSKGLANFNSDLKTPKGGEAIEILGEENFVVTDLAGETRPLAYDNSITPEMMACIGSYFNSTSASSAPSCSKFMDFAGVFYNVTTRFFNFKVGKDVFMDGFRNMNIVSYIQNLPEYYQAQRRYKGKPKDFDYVAPIIILEGMKFYEEYLLKAIQ